MPAAISPRRKALAGRAASRPAPPPEPSFSIRELTHQIDGWLVAGEAAMHSEATLALRRTFANNLLWHLRREKAESCGLPELRAFFAYVVSGHLDPGGRWGNPQQTRPVRPKTLQTYQGHLRTFFAWCVKEGAISSNPMDKLDRPSCRADQIQPFSDEQIAALLSATRRTQNARRDETIIFMLYDTGIRASELCGLKRRDLDMTAKKITVLGKGNKTRSVYFGKNLAKLLWMYLGREEWDSDWPLFASERARDKGNALHRYGLRDLIERIGAKADIQGVRCSAHTFRHTHALSYLRCGGSVEGLKERLGHEALGMTLKYVALAEADMANQRRFSPGDQLKAKDSAPPPKKAPLEPPASERLAQPRKITRSKLSEDDVRAIRAQLNEKVSRSEIAARFGVSARAIKELALGYTWKHVA